MTEDDTEAAGAARWGGRLEGDVHRLPVRIYYEDTDFSGIVYHASYLRFCERGRTELLRALGVGHAALAAGTHGEPIAFAVRSLAVEFLRPARIDDVVTVETWANAVRGASIALEQRIVGAAGVLVEAKVLAAVISPDGRPRRLPPAVRARLTTAVRG